MTRKPEQDELPADPAALETWQKLPQNPPSRSALPPMTGGMAWNRILVVGIILLAIITLVLLIAPPGTGS
ncbi:MAG: hypothetical protein IPK19_04500 [Chloroflexi bacterium]|nr:hypothetical protein [Chloroflexota bacterium]